MSLWDGRSGRGAAWVLAGLLAGGSLLGCGGGGAGQGTPPAPVDDTQGGRMSAPSSAPARRTGMGTRQKLVLLAGAAAVYYLYNKYKDRPDPQKNVQYYRSKNGRIYYRDAQHRAHWVTPPQGGMRVPEDEAQQYGLDRYQGYNGQRQGEDPGGYGYGSGGGVGAGGAGGGPPGP